MENAIRPERFARLVTLAGILIHAGREGRREVLADLQERLQLSEEELREDIDVLNVVNFGGGSYVLYAEILELEEGRWSRSIGALQRQLRPPRASAAGGGEGADRGDRSARGAHPGGLPDIGAREDRRGSWGGPDGAGPAGGPSPQRRLRRGPADLAREHRAPTDRAGLLQGERGRFSQRRVEPYALVNGREGWYVASFDPSREDMRHFRLDRIRRAEVTDERFEPRSEVDPAAEVEGWMRTGEVQASRTARLWVSPERARWARESRRVVEEHSDGSVVVELSFAGVRWLVREVLREAGDAAVLEPEDAREAVRAAAAHLREASAAPAGV